MDWDKVFEEQAAENRKASLAAEKRIAQNRSTETMHEQGVRLGWWDEEGNALESDDEDDEDEDE